MDAKDQTNLDPQALVSEWFRTANQFWAKASLARGDQEDTADDKGQGRAGQDSLFSIMKSLGTVTTALGEPSAMNALFRSFTALPDISGNILQSGSKAFLTFYRQAMEKAGKMGGGTKPYSFDNLDYETIRAWSGIYENEIRQYLNIPQLGLSRFHQEKFNRAIDRYAVFTASLAEFLHLLEMPFEKTAKVLNDKLEELTKAGSLPEDPKEYYNMWVKVLEGHFMTLFQSPEYTKVMGGTMSSLTDFLTARNDIIEDMLQTLPIPSKKEMDDLYKEIYRLKKRLRELEKGNRKD